MVTREYDCSLCGYFSVQRRISDPTEELCPECGIVAEQIHTGFPQWGMSGVDKGIPNNTSDFSEYSQWQKNEKAKYDEMLHPDNVERSDCSVERLQKKKEAGSGVVIR